MIIFSHALINYIAIGIGSLLGTWFVRCYSLKNAILDIPNERSSHALPIPRGGGLAIATLFYLGILFLYINHIISFSLLMALLGSIGITCIGYFDDLFSIKPQWRILVHFLVAVWGLYWVGLSTSGIFVYFFKLTFSMLYVVWCINFYNFMDGIDGFASTECLFVSLVAGCTLFINHNAPLANVMWLLAASTSGFLILNWPPAKIFLGDVGSGFLGYIFAIFSLYTIHEEILNFAYWWILLSIFLCDATFTLLLRIYQKKKWYAAHKEHAYQVLTSKNVTHKQVTLYAMLLNCFLLLPLAMSTLLWPQHSYWFVLIATGCLGIIWLKIKGNSSTQ